MIRGPYSKIFTKEESNNFGHFFTRIRYLWITFRTIFFDKKFSYLLFYLSTTIIGLYHIEMTYSLQLLDVVNLSPTL